MGLREDIYKTIDDLDYVEDAPTPLLGETYNQRASGSFDYQAGIDGTGEAPLGNTEEIGTSTVSTQEAAPTNMPEPIDEFVSQVPEKGFYGTFEEMFRNEARNIEPETEEQRATRERRERVRRNITAIADGLAGFATALTTAGGGNAIRLESLSDANRQRYESTRAHRERNEEAWRSGLMRARKADTQQALQREQTDWQRERQLFELMLRADREADLAEDRLRRYELNRDRLENTAEHQRLQREAQAARDARTEAHRAHQRMVASAGLNIRQQNADTQRMNAERLASGGGQNASYFGIGEGQHVAVPRGREEQLRGDITELIIRNENFNAELRRQGIITGNTTRNEAIRNIPANQLQAIVSRLIEIDPTLHNQIIEVADRITQMHGAQPQTREVPEPEPPSEIPRNQSRFRGWLQGMRNPQPQITTQTPGQVGVANVPVPDETESDVSDKWSDVWEN